MCVHKAWEEGKGRRRRKVIRADEIIPLLRSLLFGRIVEQKGEKVVEETD